MWSRCLGLGIWRHAGAFTLLSSIGFSRGASVPKSYCQDDFAQEQRNRNADYMRQYRARRPNVDYDYRVGHPGQVQINNERRAEEQVAERAANPNHDQEYRQAHPDYVRRDNERRAEVGWDEMG